MKVSSDSRVICQSPILKHDLPWVECWHLLLCNFYCSVRDHFVIDVSELFKEYLKFIIFKGRFCIQRIKMIVSLIFNVEKMVAKNGWGNYFVTTFMRMHFMLSF